MKFPKVKPLYERNKMNQKKTYSAPCIHVQLVEFSAPLALSGAEQSNMGTHTNKDIDAGNALSPGMSWRRGW